MLVLEETALGFLVPSALFFGSVTFSRSFSVNPAQLSGSCSYQASSWAPPSSGMQKDFLDWIKRTWKFLTPVLPLSLWTPYQHPSSPQLTRLEAVTSPMKRMGGGVGGPQSGRVKFRVWKPASCSRRCSSVILVSPRNGK